MAHSLSKMKTFYIFTAFFSLLVTSEGFYLNKHNPGHHEDTFLSVNNILHGQILARDGDTAEVLGDRGSLLLVSLDIFFLFSHFSAFQSQQPARLRNEGVRLSITNSLDILRERLLREMGRSRERQVGTAAAPHT